jgi:hypothetical protein
MANRFANTRYSAFSEILDDCHLYGTSLFTIASVGFEDCSTQLLRYTWVILGFIDLLLEFGDKCSGICAWTSS